MLVLAKAFSLIQTKHLVAQVDATTRGLRNGNTEKALRNGEEQRMRSATILTQILHSRNGSTVTAWR